MIDLSVFPKLFLLFMGLFLIGDAFFKSLNIREIRGLTRFAASYWIGYALYGLTVFIYGSFFTLSEAFIYGILAIGFPFMFWRRDKSNKFIAFNKSHLCSALFILAALLTFPSAMVPPVENSSLANFFAVSKYIAEIKAIQVTPFETAHTSPLLSQVINSVAYRIGGEPMMLLNNWFTSIMAGIALFALARRRLQIAPAWLLTALIFTVPVVSKTAGLGAIEPKILGMTSLALWAVLIYARSEQPKWLIISALFTASAAALDYNGIIVAITIAAAVLLIAKDFGWKYGISHNVLFILSTLIFACPWYIWNAVNLGSPLFPFGTESESFNLYKQAFLEPFTPMSDRTWGMFVNYPVELITHVEKHPVEYGVLGPLFLVTLLPAIWYFFRKFPFLSWEKQLDTPTLLITMFVVYYSIWFFNSPSLDPKAILPVLPLLVIPVWEIATQVRAKSSYIVRLSITSCLLVLLSLQMGISARANQEQIAVFFHKENPNYYVAVKDPASGVATYLKDRLSHNQRVMHTNTPTLNYHLGSSGIHASSIFAKDIPITTTDAVELLNSLMRQGIYYWVTEQNPENPLYDTPSNAHVTLRQLIKYGCFYELITQDKLYVFKFIPYCTGEKASTVLSKDTRTNIL